MARTIEIIENSLITKLQAVPEFGVLSDSNRAIWRLFSFVVSEEIQALEQIIDVFKYDNELSISQATPENENWLKNRVFLFQYSDINPQIVSIDNLVVNYSVIDETLRIITRCSVVTTLSGKVIIKVAKGLTPTALTSSELSALQSYINIIGVPGINYQCYSSEADRIYIDADIFYDGQYSSVIKANVISDLNNYFATTPFNGSLKFSDIEITIRKTVGVNDVLINNVRIRNANQAFLDGIFLIQNKTTISRIFPTTSGYVIDEDLSGHSFSDSLNFISN